MPLMLIPRHVAVVWGVGVGHCAVAVRARAGVAAALTQGIHGLSLPRQQRLVQRQDPPLAQQVECMLPPDLIYQRIVKLIHHDIDYVRGITVVFCMDGVSSPLCLTRPRACPHTPPVTLSGRQEQPDSPSDGCECAITQ